MIKNIQDEIPFDLPDSWAWTRLGVLSSSIQYGVNNGAEQNGSHRLLRITDIQDGRVDWENVPFTTIEDEEKYSLHLNDIVFARTGATVGKSFLIKSLPFPSVYASYLIRIRLIDGILSEYIYKFFNSGCYWDQITDKSIGVGQPNCNGTSLKELFIPVPPRKEQERILPKIIDTLNIISIIETNKTEINECSALIKSKILELAIQGKLVEQDENDEPASVLLERIRAKKKAQLGKKYVESYIYKGDDNCYYEKIPENWVKCSLADIAFFERGITFSASAKEMVKTENNIACIRTANVQERLELEDLIYVDKTYMKNNSNKLLKIGDIIMSSANSKELVGKSCIVTSLDSEMTFGGFVLVIRGIKVNPYFLQLYLKNLFLKGAFYRKSTQTTNIANISTRDLEMLEVCLPPLNEQAKIVQKVNDIINILEKSLS